MPTTFRRALAGLFLFLLHTVPGTASAQVTYTWTGQSNALWSVAQNWTPIGVPANGDSLVFPNGPNVRTVQNDLPAGRTFERITVTGGPYTLDGNGITIRTEFTASSGGNTVNLPVTVEAGRTIAFGTTGPFVTPLRFNGGIAGSGTLDLGTSNSVWISASGSFTGTAAATTSGRLMLGGAVMPGLQLSNISVRGWGQVGAVTNGGIFPGNGFEFLNYMSTGTGEVRSGSVSLTNVGMAFDIDGPVAGTNHDVVRVTGTLALANAQLVVAGSASYRPAVGQQLTLVDNDGTDAVSGTFQSRAEGATFVLNGATWRISYVGGTGNDIVITCLESPIIWTGAVDGQWANAGNWQGGVAPASGDSLLFPASATNKVTVNNLPAGFAVGSVSIQDSTYQFSGNGITTGGTIGSGAASGSVAWQIPLTVNAPAIATLNGGTASAAELHVSGAVSGNGQLRTGAGGTIRLSGTHPFTGTLLANCAGGCATLFLDNPTMATTNTSIASVLVFGQGQFRNWQQSTGQLWVSAVNRVTTNGPISIGTLRTANLSLNAVSLGLDIDGKAAGIEHSQIIANGSVTLGTMSRLNLRLGPQYRPAVGDVIRLIDNDGADAVSGQFVGMAEGGTVFIDGAEFSISYAGGTGNDVTLTCTHSRKVWTGAVNTLWSEAGNWIGGVPQDGDSVAFPTRTNPASTLTNDLPADRAIRNIWFGQFTSLFGQRISLQARIHTQTIAEVAFPMDFGNRTIEVAGNSGGLTLSGSITGTGSVNQGGQVVAYRGTHAYSGVTNVGTGASSFCMTALDRIVAPNWRFNLGNGWITGRGRIGAVTTSGTIGPGSSPNSLPADNGVGLMATGNMTSTAGTFAFGIEGVVPGASHDQLQVNGALSLASTAFAPNLSASHVPALGQQYVLIDNDGSDPISGTFTGVAQGATVIIGGYQFHANYTGGTGNDFVLTALNGRPASSTTLVASMNPSGAGQSFTLTATVTGAGATPTGLVTFREGTNVLGSANLFQGTATLATSLPNPGAYVLTAEYAGNASFGGGVSANLAHQVVPRYTLSYAAGSGGTISGTTTQLVNQGASGTAVTAVPNVGFRFVQWSDGITTATRTDANVQANLSATATFALQQYTVTPNAPANGSVTPAVAQQVDHGASIAFVLEPAPGYRIGGASGCGGSLVGLVYTTGPVTAACAVTFSFNRNPTATAGTLNLVEDAAEAPGTLAGVDDGALTFAIATPPTKGTLTQFNATTGAYRYQPAANQNGADAFTFTVSDGGVTSAPATVSITIAAVNDPPTIELADTDLDHPAATTGPIVHEGFALFKAGPANESAQQIQAVNIVSIVDPDGVLVPGSVTLATTGDLAYALTGGGGTATVSFRVRDNGGTALGGQDFSAIAAFSVSVPRSADLQVAKDNGQSLVLPGQSLLYAIVAANAGPDDVTLARVRDLAPSGLADLAYACDAAGSSVACPPACTGEGLLDCTLALPAGAHVRFNVLATVTAPIGSSVSNTATVSLGDAGVVGLDTANDGAIDSDPVVAEAVFADGFETGGGNLSVPAAVDALGSR